MKIIFENNKCSAAVVEKLKSLSNNEIVGHNFDEEIELVESEELTVICSLGYNQAMYDSKAVSDFTYRWIENYNKILVLKSKLQNSKINIIINTESNNAVNNSVANLLINLFESFKDACSILFVRSSIELMANANFARMRFNYTESFTAQNIEKIEKLSALINDKGRCVQIGLILNTSI